MLFKDITDEHLPIKKMRVRANDIPYMNQEWKKAIREKRKYAKMYANKKSPENWELKRKWRNIATKERRKAIKTYWLKKSDDLKKDPREFYKTFRPFLSKKTKEDVNISIKINGKVEEDQQVVAEQLADYFSTVANEIGGKDVKNLNEEKLEHHRSVEAIRKQYSECSTFNFESTSATEVKLILNKIKTRKASGWDAISPNTLKLASNGIAQSLASFYNRCIHQCLWPTDWKMGEWTPVFKRDDRQEPNNYRPVTVLTSVDKVFETILSKQITRVYDPLLYPRMTAYRKSHSCETTLLRLIEDWKIALDQKKSVVVLSTDMSKAFDSLHPALLVQKLKAYKFSEKAQDLMRSFFNQRLNRVKIKGKLSSWKEVIRGCPQGSSFGPLLWNLFQNDMFLTITKSHLSMYADDHQLYNTGTNIDEVEQDLKNEAITVSKWYKNNLLKPNMKKYQTLVITPRGQAEGIVNLNLEGCDIKSTTCLKLLGVNIDNELNFSQHISEICKKASQKVGVINRLRKLIPTQAKLQLYKSTILPHLTYCHTVWHFCKASDKRKLERIQERALRAIFNDKQLSYEDLLKKGKLTSLYNRRLQDIAILMFKAKYGISPSYINELFESNDKGLSLRNAEDFCLPRYNTVTSGRHSLRFFGPYLWSRLSKKDKEIQSLNAFKNTIRNKDLGGLLEVNCNNCQLCSE